MNGLKPINYLLTSIRLASQFSKQSKYITNLTLPNLKIDNRIIKRETSVKFLGVIINENLNWSNQINYVLKKVCKNIGILYKIKSLLNSNCLKLFYYAFIHSHINYANIVWASTNQTKLKKLFSKQKAALRLLPTPMQKENLLNIYQINLFQTILLMFKWKQNNLPRAYNTMFSVPRHKYTTRVKLNSFTLQKSKTKRNMYAISYRGPKIWNKFLSFEKINLSCSIEFRKWLKQKVSNISLIEIFSLF